MGNGCCGSREDWCSGTDKELKREMIDLKYQSKENAYLLNDIRDSIRPQKQPMRSSNEKYDRSPNQQYSPDSRSGREQGNNSDDGKGTDRNNEYQGRNGNGYHNNNNMINESILSDKLLQEMNIIRQGKNNLAKNYKGNMVDMDQSTVVEINMHLEIDLYEGRIVGFVINQGQTELVGHFLADTREFKLTWKGISKEDIFTGRFTKQDFSALEGEIRLASFDLDDDDDDESTPADKIVNMVEI